MTTQIPAVVLTGADWSAVEVRDGVFLVSVANHRELIGALTDFLAQCRITSAHISGIGAVNHAVMRFFDPQTKHYVDTPFDEQMELSNLTGNVAIDTTNGVDGATLVHIHATLGRQDYSALAGHLREATISGACEIFVTEHTVRTTKNLNRDIGLNIYDLS